MDEMMYDPLNRLVWENLRDHTLTMGNTGYDFLWKDLSGFCGLRACQPPNLNCNLKNYSKFVGFFSFLSIINMDLSNITTAEKQSRRK